MATCGGSPGTVWRDRDRVRFQYRLAIDYALRTVADYAARHAADPPLILVVGDRQAAGFITSTNAPMSRPCAHRPRASRRARRGLRLDRRPRAGPGRRRAPHGPPARHVPRRLHRQRPRRRRRGRLMALSPRARAWLIRATQIAVAVSVIVLLFDLIDGRAALRELAGAPAALADGGLRRAHAPDRALGAALASDGEPPRYHLRCRPCGAPLPTCRRS